MREGIDNLFLKGKLLNCSSFFLLARQYIWYHLSFIEYPLSLIFDCIYRFKVVARGGLEPPTQGFSVLCSTN